MLRLFDADLVSVKARLDAQVELPRLAKNMPLTAGRVKANKEMRGRLAAFRAKFDDITMPIMETTEGRRVELKYQEIMTHLDSSETEIFAAWAADVDSKADVNLDRPLLNRLQSGECEINFDPQLASVLREVHYLLNLEGPGSGSSNRIPERAAEMFEQNSQFRGIIGNLDIAVTEYNRIQETLLDVEEPLVQGELDAIDVLLERGIAVLNWKSPEANEYSNILKTTIEQLSNRILQIKANVAAMLEEMATWFAAPSLVRDNKTGLVLFASRTKAMEPTITRLRKSGESFAALTASTAELFRADVESLSWHSYAEFLDSLVLDGLFNTVHIGLAYFLDLMDKTATENPDGSPVRPLFDGKMSLLSPSITFQPGIKATDPKPSLVELINSIVDEFFMLGTNFPRVAAHLGRENYHADLQESEDLRNMREEMNHKTQSAIGAMMDHEAALLKKYEYDASARPTSLAVAARVKG